MDETWDGRQLAAARALAGLTVRQLAEHARTTKRAISDLETRGMIHVAETRRHSHVSREVWNRVVDALRDAGVELLPEGRGYGSGARWTRPRANRARVAGPPSK